MNQILVSMNRTLKEYTRNRVIIVSTVGIPLFFLLLFPNTMLDVPAVLMPQIKGYITITMISLLIMSAGQANLAGFIAADRERGLYRKILSMPVKIWKETIGRVLAIWLFSFIAITLTILISLFYGAEFNFVTNDLIVCLIFLIVIGLASTGTGLIISSFVKNESASTHLGVGISLLVFFLGGMAIPFSDLPKEIQIFAQVHPVSSATSSIIYLILGEEFAGYNPMNTPQILTTLGLSFILFILGIIIFSEFVCKRNQ